jgi:hypothetical protein
MNVLLRAAGALAVTALTIVPTTTSLAAVPTGPDPAGPTTPGVAATGTVHTGPHPVCARSMVWDEGCFGPR